MATTSPCEDPHCNQCERYPEVVERLIRSTSEANTLRRVLRDLAEQQGDPSLGALLMIYATRLIAADDNVRRLVAEREKAA